MAPNATAVQFGGLLVALGLFSIGPASTMMDELMAIRKKKRADNEKSPESHLEHEQEHSTAEELKRRYTTTSAHPEINDFLSHPFQPAVASNNNNNTNRPAQPAKNNEMINSTNPPSSWLSFLGTAPPKSSE
jgi:hypothetical protein